MTITEAIKLTKSMLSKHPELRYWSVTANNRKSAYGMCNYTYRTISLSKALTPNCTDKAIQDTIIHEIAHALCPGQKHNEVWRRKCIELGGDGKRAGGQDKLSKDATQVMKEISNWTLTCPSCGKINYINRKPKYSQSCGVCCKGRYNEAYKLTLKANR